MKRSRSRGRRGGANPNRSLESNGPDVKVRGAPNLIHDKYLQLSRDASSSGDRIKAENYLQHAEHYYRIMAASQPRSDSRSDDQDDDESYDGDDDVQASNGSEGGRNNGRKPRRKKSSGGDNGSGDNADERGSSDADAGVDPGDQPQPHIHDGSDGHSSDSEKHDKT
jgi:hypothetical protein